MRRRFRRATGGPSIIKREVHFLLPDGMGVSLSVKIGEECPSCSATQRTDLPDASAMLAQVCRYFFKLYALDTELDNLGEPTKAQLEKAMAGHIFGEAQLVGTYQKSGK